METQYTPGPWRVHERYPFWVESMEGKGIADLEGRGGVEETKANARLIAAAPELLEACEKAYGWLDRFGEHAPITFGGEDDLSETLRAAIAKARGEGEEHVNE